MSHLKRISSLFKDDQTHYPLLVELSKIGVIAGGSIVYVLNDYVPDKSVGDVDIFCNSEENFIKALDCIREHCGNTDDIQYHVFAGLNPYELSVLTITIPNERVKYQLIYKEFDGPEDVINDFDFDYVQCAIHSGKLYITKECKESHMAKKVLKFRDMRFRNDRLLKAMKKGFQCPVLTDSLSFEFPINEINHDTINKSNVSQVAAFKNNPYFEIMDREEGFLSTDSLKVVGFNFIKRWKDCNYFGKFIVDCGKGRTIERSIISVEMDVEANVGRYVDIKDGLIRNLFDTIKKKDPDMKIPLGKNIFLIEGYMIYRKFKAKIIDMVPNALPIHIADKLSFIGHRELTVWTGVKPKYHKVMEEIDRLKNGEQFKLNKHKIDAYECFLYYVTHDNDQKDAINLACQQMNADKYKQHGDALASLGLAMFSRDIKTVDEMIKFIDGYH